MLLAQAVTTATSGFPVGASISHQCEVHCACNMQPGVLGQSDAAAFAGHASNATPGAALPSPWAPGLLLHAQRAPAAPRGAPCGPQCPARRHVGPSCLQLHQQPPATHAGKQTTIAGAWLLITCSLSCLTLCFTSDHNGDCAQDGDVQHRTAGMYRAQVVRDAQKWGYAYLARIAAGNRHAATPARLCPAYASWTLHGTSQALQALTPQT